MTYEQYWYGDPLMVGAYYKAEKIREELRDIDAWKQGMYVANAIECTIGNAFLSKGKEPAKYPKQPILTEERVRKETERRKKTEEIKAQEAVFAKAYMMSMMETGKNWGKT